MLAESSRLEDVLLTIPQAQWATSNRVARAYLESSRVKGILKHIGYQNGLPESLYPDVMQNGWVVLGRYLPTLDESANVYSLIYRIFYLCTRTIQAKNHSSEVLRTEEEEGDEEKLIKPLANFENGTHDDHANSVIVQVDRAAAQARFIEKRKKYKWPDDIISDASQYRRVGRPRKEDAL